ncbi:hypothetical protein WMF45_23175 [Sorangium sp. So ce448]|uniref:hypothetical protein n=1 Tax=Sorangium sp. So ce448 TaxID=3133314 RepID=UPI003F637977
MKIDEGPWELGPLRSEVQEFHLEVILADALKGAIAAKAGDPIHISGHRSRPGPREASVPPGVWSSVDLAVGARLVAFSSASSPHAALVFAEPALLRMLPSAPAEDEVRRALTLERAGGPLSARIQTVTEPPALSPLFGEYVVARLAEDTLYRDAVGFDQVMAWLEDPGRSPSLQMFVIQSLVGKVLLTEPNPPGFTERLALATWRVLSSTQDEALATQIVDTYLPNLLGLEGAAPFKSVQTVFHGDEGARTLGREALLRRPAGGARDRLLGWIGR